MKYANLAKATGWRAIVVMIFVVCGVVGAVIKILTVWDQYPLLYWWMLFAVLAAWCAWIVTEPNE